MASDHVPQRRHSEALLKLQEKEESAGGGKFHTQYEPKEILGKGLSSTVRKCVCKETGREYAVKIVDRKQEQSITESIAVEIEILRSLPHHKHIINLVDVFESDAFVFMVFELATGGELFDYLTKMVKLSEKRTRQVMFQLFQAVEHMHTHNIIHRDLKPENILLDDHLNVKVSDFGFATICKPEDSLSELLGTPGYLAPEMLRRNVEPGAPGYNHPIDMWACGVIMYTLLAGFPPFWHRKQLMMLRNIMDGKYEFVSPEWDIISDSAKDLISKLLVTDPGKRLTASEALCHPFLQFQQVEFRVFSGLRKFKGAVYCVWSCRAFERMLSKRMPKTFTLASIGDVPYENRFVRQLVDSCAFHIYGHWVKRGEEQNRALLFETAPKKLNQISSQALLLSSFSRPRSLWSH